MSKIFRGSTSTFSFFPFFFGNICPLFGVLGDLIEYVWVLADLRRQFKDVFFGTGKSLTDIFFLFQTTYGAKKLIDSPIICHHLSFTRGGGGGGCAGRRGLEPIQADTG